MAKVPSEARAARTRKTTPPPLTAAENPHLSVPHQVLDNAAANGDALPADIVVLASERTSFVVELVGQRYAMRPPKSSLSLKFAVRAKQAGEAPELLFAAVNEWIEAAFGVEVARQITERLDDDADALDFPHLTDLMSKVAERTTGNPTT